MFVHVRRLLTREERNALGFQCFFELLIIFHLLICCRPYEDTLVCIAIFVNALNEGVSKSGNINFKNGGSGDNTKRN